MDKLRTALSFLLNKAFDIREGEFNRAILMMIYIFLIISTLLMVKPAVNSLFLSKFGVEQLPYAFLLVSLFAGIVVTIYSRILKKTTLDKIINTSLKSSIIALCLFWILFKFNILEGLATYSFYIWVSIFAVISASQFWVLANIIFNAREAKRLFGFIGAGAIAGGIFGGYLTTILAATIGSENILIVCIIFLVICIQIVKTIWEENVVALKTNFQRRKAINTFSDHPIKLIKKSKHLLYLASIVGVSVIVAKLVDYQFNAVASAEIGNEDELTAFFGFWYSNLNIVSLLIQLFVTRRVVGTLGVGTSLFFLPAGIFLGSIGLLIDPALWAAVLLKINDGSLKQSVNKSSMELLALPIPSEIKNQTKSFIDIFIDSFATGIGGIVLILFTYFLDLPVRFVTLITIIFLFGWFYLALKVKHEYRNSFKMRLDNDKDSNAHIPDLTNQSIINSLIKALDSGTENQRLIILKMVKDIQNEALANPFRSLLAVGSAEVKIETLRNLNSFTTARFHREVEKLIYDEDYRVRIEAFNYLFEFPESDAYTLIQKHISNSDPQISEPALLSAAVEVCDNIELKEKLNISALIRKKISTLQNVKTDEELTNQKTLIARVIGSARLDDLYPQLNDFLKDSNIEVVKASIYAAGQTLNSYFISALVPFLEKDHLREQTKQALFNYGPLVVDSISGLINNTEISLEIRKSIPSILEKIGTQKSVDTLYTFIDYEDFSIRTESLKSLNQLRRNFPHLNFLKKGLTSKILDEAKVYLETLSVLYVQLNLKPPDVDSAEAIKDARNSLIKILERRLDGNLERIFRLLGLNYPPEDIIGAYKGIQSTKPELRLNAIEFLDNLLDPNLKRIIIPLVELTGENVVSDELFDEFDVKIPSEFECFETLLGGKDKKLVIATLYLIQQTRDVQYKYLVKKLSVNPNEKVSNMAKLTLQKML